MSCLTSASRVAVLSCCTETLKGRSRVRNRPLTWVELRVELRGSEPLTPRCEGGPLRSSVSLSVAQCEAKQLDRTLERAQHGLTSVTAGSQPGSHNPICLSAPVVAH